jgi:hypothetical protein
VFLSVQLIFLRQESAVKYVLIKAASMYICPKGRSRTEPPEAVSSVRLKAEPKYASMQVEGKKYKAKK